MAATIPGFFNAQQTAEHLNITIQHVYNLNSADNDFPTAVYVGRTPLWPVDQLDAWRVKHPARAKAS
jgi:hypothetical protein